MLGLVDVPLVSASPSWANDDFTSRIKITLDNTASAENLVNFQVLINLTGADVNWAHIQNDLDDIRFYDSDGTTLLDAELEGYTTNTNATIWVEVPQIDKEVDTDYIWMYYGNVGVGSDWDPEGTWGLEIVQHLQEASGNVIDSTTNDNDGVVTGASYGESGWIHDCLYFDGSEYVTFPSVMMPADDVFTVEAWAKRDGAQASHAMVYSEGNTGSNTPNYMLGTYATSHHALYGVRNGGQLIDLDNHTVPDATWTYLAFTCTGDTGTATLYVDAISRGSQTKITGTPSVDTTHLGVHERTGLTYYFKGWIDEFRISYAVRSADWVEAQYLSMTGAFVTYGAEERRVSFVWWDTDWHSRVPINITGSTVGYLTNYPVQFNLLAGSGTCSGNNIYTNGTAQADYDDVRFIADDQVTLYNYWLVDNHTWVYPNATVWVNVTFIPTSPNNVTMWVYWGNPGASSVSNGANVFPFFDDMLTDPNVNPDWSVAGGGGGASGVHHLDWFIRVGGSPVSDGWATMKGTENNILAGGSSTYGWSMEWDNAIMHNEGDETFCYYGVALGDDFWHMPMEMDDIYSGVSWYWGSWNPFSGRRFYYNEWNAGGAAIQSNGTIYPWSYGTSVSVPVKWTRYEMTLFSDHSYVVENGTLYREFKSLSSNYLTAGLDPSYSAHGKAGDGAYMKGFVNWVFLRPLADPEPTLTLGAGQSLVVDVGIHNMEGCGDWVFEGRTQYEFYINVSLTGDVGSEMSAGIGFYDDAGSFYSFYYSNETNRITLVSPDDGISASLRDVETGDDWLYVNFTVMFNPTIADTLDVDLYARYYIPTTGDSGWCVYTADYFNIYNLGGLATLTSTGYSGRTAGGDVFEIYAADERVAKMFYESFELRWDYYTDEEGRPVKEEAPIPWILASDPPYSNITTTKSYPNTDSRPYAYSGTWRDGKRGLRIQTADATNIIPWTARRFLRPITAETVMTTVWWQGVVNTSTARLKWADMPTYLSAAREAVNLRIHSLGGTSIGEVTCEINNIVYDVWDAGAANPIRWYTDTWYNITVHVNMTSSRWTLWWNGAATNATNEVFADGAVPTSLEYFLALGSDGLGGAEQADFYIDAVNTTTDFSGNYGGNVTATTLFNRLQHWHMDFDLDVEDGYVAPPYADYGYVELGWDICLNGTWENNFLVARVNITSADIPSQSVGWTAAVGEAIKGITGGKANWVQFNVTWTQNGTYVKHDTLYGLYEGYGNLATTEGAKNAMGFHWDMWFNSMNASTVVGGRINPEWFGMSDKVSGIASIWASEWKPMVDEETDSTCFTNLVDSSGSIHTAKEVTLVRSWVRVWRSNQDTFHYEIKNIEGMDFRRIKDVMKGIDTPPIIKTLAPQVPSAFMGSAIGAIFKGIMAEMLNSIKLGVGALWTAGVGLLGIVAGYFGLTTLISTASSIIGSASAFLVTLLAENYVFGMIGVVFTVVTSTFGHIIYWLTNVLTTLTNIFTIVWALIDGTYTGAGALVDMWATFGWATWSDAVPVFAIIAWFDSLDRRWRANNKQGWFGFMFADLKIMMEIISFFLDVTTKIIDLSVTLIVRLINAIPGM